MVWLKNDLNDEWDLVTLIDSSNILPEEIKTVEMLMKEVEKNPMRETDF